MEKTREELINEFHQYNTPLHILQLKIDSGGELNDDEKENMAEYKRQLAIIAAQIDEIDATAVRQQAQAAETQQ